jgi:hypothetical protein
MTGLSEIPEAVDVVDDLFATIAREGQVIADLQRAAAELVWPTIRMDRGLVDRLKNSAAELVAIQEAKVQLASLPTRTLWAGLDRRKATLKAAS